MKRKMPVKRIYSLIFFLFLPTSSLLLSNRQSPKIELSISILENSKYKPTSKFEELVDKKGKISAPSSPLLPQISSSLFAASSPAPQSSMGNSIERTSSISSDYLSSLGINLDDPPTPSSMSSFYRRQRRSLRLYRNASDPFIPVDSQTPKNTSSTLDFKELNNVTTEPCQLCRHRDFLPVHLYNLDTCAYCYNYMRNSTSFFGSPSKKLKSGVGAMTKEWDPESGQYYLIRKLLADGEFIISNVSNPDERITKSFDNKDAQAKWVDCCLAAERCCETMQKSSYYQSGCLDGGDKLCPPTWDGWQCWTATPAAVIAEAFCPPYIYSITEPSSCTSTAQRECSVNGTWFKNAKNQEWTNYGQCGNASVTLQWNRAYVHVAAYYISIIAITPALAIFFAYKQLRVHRIILHQNLFMSMLLNGILVIVFKTTVILNELKSGSDGPTIISENGIGCRLLFILTKYSRMTNYMWMFCEGFYLHKLIAAAFAEQKSLLVFYLIGWVFPIIPTAVYAGFRILAANDRCWVVPQESWEWALNGPSLLSLLINVLFLINIIRVLVTKLRAAHAQEPSQYRKAVRATLVLLPLFGVHFIVTIYRPSSSSGACLWTELYFYTNDILDGLQGFLVALIFCYCNTEVSALLKRTYTRWKEQHANGSICDRRKSNANLRSRNSRAGSMLGRSVVSTHIYSSVPPSPEPNSTSTQNVMVTLAPRVALSESNSNSSLKNRSSCNNIAANTLTLNGKSSVGVGVNLYVTTSDAKSGNVMSETRLAHPGDTLELKELEGKSQSPKSCLARNGQSNEQQL